MSQEESDEVHVLVLQRPEEQSAYDKASAEEQAKVYAGVEEWAAKYAGKLGTGEQLQRPSTAKTIDSRRFPRDTAPVITDGPFVEGKEVIGGFWVIDVEDLDEALKVAKEWPASSTVEIGRWSSSRPKQHREARKS